VNNKLIIDTPKLQSLRLKYTSTVLTMFFWIIWFYLWVPLITLFGWWFQIDTIQHNMVTLGGYRAFLEELPSLLTSIIILSSSLAIWGAYNFIRFKGVERRKALHPVTQYELLATFAINEEELIEIQKSSIIELDFDQSGNIHSTIIK
jgi:biofilm PGA synthesis protein PgaD